MPGCLWLGPLSTEPPPPLCHRIILVLAIGGKDYIIPKRRQYIYLVYKRYILPAKSGDNVPPTNFYGNQKQPLSFGDELNMTAMSQTVSEVMKFKRT